MVWHGYWIILKERAYTRSQVHLIDSFKKYMAKKQKPHEMIDIYLYIYIYLPIHWAVGKQPIDTHWYVQTGTNLNNNHP